jgi:hypothetical protein
MLHTPHLCDVILKLSLLGCSLLLHCHQLPLDVCQLLLQVCHLLLVCAVGSSQSSSRSSATGLGRRHLPLVIGCQLLCLRL